MVLLPSALSAAIRRDTPAPYIRTAHGNTPQALFTAESYYSRTVGIAQNDLRTHINQLVNKKQPAFKHFLVNKH